MNIVSAKYQNKVFVEQSRFEFDVDGCKISLCLQTNNLVINIKGRKGTKKLESLLADVESLLFIYSGSFPAISSLCINEIEQDLTDRINKYKTSCRFVKKNLVLCSINLETVNSDTINKMRTAKRTPMFSLQYIVSETYDPVVHDHKITLLLHVVQAYVDKKIIEKEKEEARSDYPVLKKQKIGDYFAVSYHLCKNYFFKYHRKYNCEILKLLNKSQYDFLRTMTDTRNWYSHFFDETKKLSRLKNGKDMMVYFEIIYFAIRLMIMDDFGVKPKEDAIKEFYLSVHDWIAKVYKRDVPPKSIAYTTIAMIEKFKINEKN